MSAAILGTGLWIDERESDPEEDRHHPLDKLANAFEPFGAAYSLVLLGGFYAAGKWRDAPRELGVAEDGLMASVIASGIVTPALKWAVGRVRPSDTTDKSEFHPFGTDHSFPSGHATQAFAIASVISRSYESPWVSAASYASAVLVAYARHQHRAHWESDLVCGAAIGYAVGQSVVSQNAANRRVSLSVVGSDQGPMLALSIPLR